MKRNQHLGILTLLAVIGVSSWPGGTVHAAAESRAPQDFPVSVLFRSESTGLQLDTALTKNEFNTYTHEEVQAVQVPYSVKVAYQVVETYYVTVKICRDESHPVNVCHKEKICVRYPTYHCYSQNVCHIEHHIKQVCHKEKQPHTRVVTKYRWETHYRTEYQTVLVTDTVFSHQWGVNASVLFPEGAALSNGA